MNKQVMATVLGGALAAAALAGCSVNEHTEHGNGAPGQSQHSGHSQDPDQPQSPGQDHSGHGMPAPSADVSFAQAMVPHHQQAVQMADMVPSRTHDQAVTGLANRIRAAQQPEIDRLNGWLAAWKPGAQEHQSHDMGDMGNMGNMGHQGHQMSGMMSAGDMAALEKARDADFDRMWLRMMIQHHQGAVEMAKAELAGGRNADAKAMAQHIIDSQQAEINEMNGLLGNR